MLIKLSVSILVLYCICSTYAHSTTLVADAGELAVVDETLSPRVATHLVDGAVPANSISRFRHRKHVVDRSKKQITRRIIGEGRRKPRRPSTGKENYEKKLRRGSSAGINDWTALQRTTMATPTH